MGNREALERDKFDVWWKESAYRRRFGPGSEQYETCWKAWKRCVASDTSLREWNRELVKSIDYERYGCERCDREDMIAADLRKKALL
jgi:hypothetical protein